LRQRAVLRSALMKGQKAAAREAWGRTSGIGGVLVDCLALADESLAGFLRALDGGVGGVEAARHNDARLAHGAGKDAGGEHFCGTVSAVCLRGDCIIR
jgi:hypothetical protein